MNHLSNYFGKLALLLSVVLVGTAYPFSDAERDQLKSKLSAGASLSQSEIHRILELRDEGWSLVDDWEISQLKKYGRIGDRPASTRRPGNTLDEYAFSEITYNFHDISVEPDVIELTNLSDDGVYSPYALGFTFTLYEESFSSISICSNGFISNTSNTNGDWTNNPIPDPESPNTIIAPFWDDLWPNAATHPGHIYFWPDPAGDRAIVQWSDCISNLQGGPGPQTLQVQLFSNGNIEYHYETINGGDLCTVGIENENGDDGLEVAFDGTGWLPSSGTAILIGQMDGFPNPVTDLQASIADNDVVLTWTDPTEDTNGNPLTIDNVQVWLGQPGTGIQLATVAAGVQTYTHEDAPDGNLTYYVRPYADPYMGSAASVGIIVGDPSYLEDFEATAGLWESDNADGWQWGTPTNGPAAAHSGGNCWGTLLDDNYPGNACFNLTLNPELTVESAGATVEFWAWWNVEETWDGCNFKVSIDGGQTWELVDPLDGYPTQINEVNTCNPNEAAWAGITNEWTYIVIPIGQYVGQVPQFRFVFGSDEIVNNPGFFFDDMIIWGLAEPVGADLSGTITLDGGNGDVEAVVVRADGLGAPQTNPAANGEYTLTDVLTGDRVVWAQLTGYHSATTTVTLPEGGLTGIDLTLLREDPAAPTGLDGTIDGESGIVTLTWIASTDPLVDSYNIYRKLQTDDSFVNIGNSNTIEYTDDLTLPGSGIYQYAVSAVDEDVSTPVESELTNPVTILYGELPPVSLSANGEFDDKIVLDWFEPGTQPEFELSYDNGTNEIGGLGFWQGTPTFGWMVSRFETTEGPIAITKIKLYITDSALEGDVFEIGVFADNGGVPTFNPLGVTSITQQGPFNNWFEWELDSPVTLTDGIAWVGHRQITANQGVSVGGDNTTAFPNSTFMYSYDAIEWTSFEPDLLTIPMQRCYAIGSFGEEIVLAPSPVEVEHLQSTVVGTKDGRDVTGIVIPKNWMTTSNDYKYNFGSLLDRAADAVAPHAPHFRPVDTRGHGNTLDDVVYYIVYRDDLDIAHPTEEHYEDTGLPENVEYSYYVTAFYDNDEESGLSNTVVKSCNMAPAAPTNLSGSPEGEASSRLTWNDPDLNQDGTPCVDLTAIHIYRNGIFVASVAAGLEEYVDTPEEGPGTYSWTIAAADEVPNLSEESASYFGPVGNPSYSNGFEFDNGLWESESGWERGMPTSGPAAAFSGENCWGTILNGTYDNDVCYNLTLIPELSVVSENATVEFWCWYESEFSFDGCQFKVSTDNGESWEIIDPVRPYDQTSFFNTNECQPNERGWAGYDQGFWEYMIVPIGQFVGEVLQYRFVFGSDGSVLYPGFYFDDMTIWGLAEPVTATVTGQVTLDGGAGDVEDVIVRADGLGIPETNPESDGSYSLDNVLIGNRTVRGFLDGYEISAAPVFVSEAGPNVADLTLVRSDPPVVTGLTGSVENATGEVTLNWDDSTDPLVDNYYVYTRFHNTTEWTHAATVAISETIYQLPEDGIWDITVTAVDEDVSTPVESAYAPSIMVLYGALPPNGLTAIGEFDDKILLSWFEPGNDLGQEIVYDDGTAEAFVTVSETNGTEDRLAVKFTSPPSTEVLYPLEISACAVFLENQTQIASLSICPLQTWNEFPDVAAPWAEWNGVSAETTPGWLTAETGGSVVIDEPQDFWVVVRLVQGQHGPGVGGDITAVNSCSYSSQFTWNWIQDFTYDYLMRVWIRGGAGQRSGGNEYLLSNGGVEGYQIERIPHAYSKIDESNVWNKEFSKDFSAKTADKVVSSEKSWNKNKESVKSIESFERSALSRTESFSRNDRIPFVRAPELELRSLEPREGALDDIDYYIVYRDGSDIGHPTGTSFEDTGLEENVSHTYQITSHYDDASESAPSNTATASCNMAPSAPSGLSGTPLGNSQMTLTWTNPVTNQDGTSLVDLASTRIYRDGNLIGTVNASQTTFNDTPPSNDQPYTWTVAAIDEVPNESADSEPFTGYVVSPWEVVDYEWIDITSIGTSANTTGDDSTSGPINLGFSFEFFGETYTSIHACTNGWASFTSTSTAFTNTDLPDPTQPNCGLYPYWDDLAVYTGADILYYADAANNRFILTWNNVPHLGGSAPNTFQVVISENGGIQFNYNVLDLEETPSFTVGVENSDGTNAVRLCYNGLGDWCAEAQSSLAIWGSPSGEVRGQVREFGSNLPIPNVAVWSIGHVDTAYTAANGFYSLPVDTGMHDITIHLQGYCDHVYEDIHIEDGQSYVQNASMLWPNFGINVSSLNLITTPQHDVADEFTLSNTGAGCPLSYSITVDQDWLSLSVSEGDIEINGTQLVTVTAHVSEIEQGEYNANVEVVHNDVGSPYIIPVNLIVGVDAFLPEIPDKFAFHQNYPNPFNATTAFRIDLPLESRVELVIFNVMGQIVDRPVMASYPAGRHTIMYTAEALPSGMYIARVNAGSFTGLQKIVLLK